MGKPQYTEPRLIGTWLYSEFVASATKWKDLFGVLNRNATLRTFIIVNSMDQPTSSTIVFQPEESTVTSTTSSQSPSNSSGNAVNANASLVISGQYGTQINANVDSVKIGMPMGATLPTMGDIKVYVVEVC